MPVGSQRRGRGVVRLTLTEPAVAPMTEEEHRQAVGALAAMISDWLRKRAASDGGRESR